MAIFEVSRLTDASAAAQGGDTGASPRESAAASTAVDAVPPLFCHASSGSASFTGVNSRKKVALCVCVCGWVEDG
jgi:hypothetical protein